MKALVSVRNVAEALVAARAGVAFIDLKEPSQGALGGLDIATLTEVVSALRRDRGAVVISATIGDFEPQALAEITAQVRRVAACGVDHVKVGVQAGPAAPALVRQLAVLQAEGVSLVPVLIADQGVPDELVRQVAQGGFPAAMLDTQDKRAGSLFDLMALHELASFVAQVRAGGAMAGLSGALRLKHAPDLVSVGPDFAGFRSAVCRASRESALDADLLRQLLHTMEMAPALTATASA
jgi:uncharacterized protein (UPF0264 family)